MKAIVSIKKGLAMVLAAALTIGSVSVPADAAETTSTQEQIKLEVGDTETIFSATVSPDTATPSDADAITFQSPNDDVVRLSVSESNGVKRATITALKEGTATITAMKGTELHKTWNVSVSAKTQIGLNKTEITLKEGEGSASLAATVTPDTGKVVTWKSDDPSVIVTPGDGNTATVTAKKTGSTRNAIIRATVKNVRDENVETTCTVHVTSDAVQVDSVTLNKTTLALTVGGSETLTATVLPETAENKTLTWTSSVPGVATVEGGKVTALAAGETVITAKTANGKTATCTVTVTAGGTTTVPVTGVTVTPETLSLVVNGTSTLTAAVAPANATNKAVTWSTSAPAVATVDAATGVVKAIAVGTATITATTADGNKTATCTVTVTAAATNVPVTGVSLSAKTLVVGKNITKNLKATVAPATATNKNVTWVSSNKTIATVDARGNVKGIRKGTAVITATSSSNPNVKATCAVTVTEVTLNKTALTMEYGQSGTLLKATLSNTRLDSLVAWKTSNATVVRVDARTGKLTALNKAGWANITITTKAGATATCKVTVKAPAVKSVTLNVKKLTMGVKESYKLNATVNPANAVNKKVTWTSDKPKVVKVKNGKLTALKAGKAKITVTSQADKSKKATITVTVKKTPDKKAKVTLNKKKVNLKVKKTFQIKAKISSKYGCASFKYTVDKKGKKVVKVDKNGKVTAKKKGKATITVKPYNGKGKSATIQITVK